MIFTINVEQSAFYYALFYFMASVIGFPLLLYYGVKRKIPIIAWLLIILTVRFVFILGTKLFYFEIADWKYFLSYLELPDKEGRSIIGGMLSIWLVILFFRYYYKISLKLLEPFAYLIPLVISIQKVGCLLYGCCYGTTVNSGFGILYGSQSIAYLAHQQQGILNANAATSLLVHPVQLYESLFCLIIIGIIFKYRKSFRAPGNLMFFSLLLYLCFRFFIEFLKQPVIGYSIYKEFHGLYLIQFMLAVMVLLLLALILVREKHFYETKEKVIKLLITNPIKDMVLLTIIIFLLIVGNQWFKPLELFVLKLFLLIALIGILVRVNVRFTQAQTRWIPSVMLVMCLLFMGQSSLKMDDNDKPENYHSVGIGAMFGKYMETFSSGGCSGPSDYRNYTSEFKSYGASYSYNHFSNKSAFRKGELRVGLSSTKEITDFTTSSYSRTDLKNSYTSFRILYKYDWHSFGLGFGANFGKQSIYNSENENVVMPQFDIRIGPYDILFAELNWGSHLPASFPLPEMTYGLGTGFGRTDGTSLMVGGSAYSGLYFRGTAIIRKRFVISPFIALGNKKETTDPIYSISMGYRILPQRQGLQK